MTCGGRKERKQERNEAGRANGTVAVAAGGDSSIGPGYRLALSGGAPILLPVVWPLAASDWPNKRRVTERQSSLY